MSIGNETAVNWRFLCANWFHLATEECMNKSLFFVKYKDIVDNLDYEQVRDGSLD